MFVDHVTTYRMTCSLKSSDVIWRSWSGYNLVCKTGVSPCQIRFLVMYGDTVSLDGNPGTRAPGHHRPGPWSQGIFLFIFLIFFGGSCFFI